MSILRKKSKSGWTTVNNAIIEDARLSWNARGIALYLLSKKDDWNVIIRNIANNGPSKESLVKSALGELAEYGYMKRTRERQEDGTIRTITHIADYPAFIDDGTADERRRGYYKESSNDEKSPTPNFSDGRNGLRVGSDRRSVESGVLINTDLPSTDYKPITEKEKINNDDDGLTPQAVRKLFEESGMYTTEHDFIPKVAQMIDSHGAEKVLRGIATVEEIHRNKMDSGKQGIWSPGEYLAKILTSEDASNGKAKRIMPKSNDAEMKRMEAMGL